MRGLSRLLYEDLNEYEDLNNKESQGEYDKNSDSYLNSDYEEVLYRSKIYTDNNGNYAYQTILPGKYLNSTYYRPSHIHYKSSYLEQNELTTQFYKETRKQKHMVVRNFLNFL